MALFIVLPFLGGWIGYTFAPEKMVEVERVVVQEVVAEREVLLPSIETVRLEDAEQVPNARAYNYAEAKKVTLSNGAEFTLVPPADWDTLEYTPLAPEDVLVSESRMWGQVVGNVQISPNENFVYYRLGVLGPNGGGETRAFVYDVDEKRSYAIQFTDDTGIYNTYINPNSSTIYDSPFDFRTIGSPSWSFLGDVDTLRYEVFSADFVIDGVQIRYAVTYKSAANETPWILSPASN